MTTLETESLSLSTKRYSMDNGRARIPTLPRQYASKIVYLSLTKDFLKVKQRLSIQSFIVHLSLSYLIELGSSICKSFQDFKYISCLKSGLQMLAPSWPPTRISVRGIPKLLCSGSEASLAHFLGTNSICHPFLEMPTCPRPQGQC